MTPSTSGITGAQLARDKADRYRSLGSFGKPAYQGHVQLRAMLRSKRGDRFANYFARPTFDADSGELRWTAEVPGAARGWHEMTPAEQAACALDLEVIRSGLLGLVRELREQGGSQPGGAAAFASLLEQAMKVPAPGDFLYFVGVQPVIAFWGFESQDGVSVDPAAQGPRQAVQAPSRIAQVPGTAVPVGVEPGSPQEAGEVVPTRRRRRWWWLLWLVPLALAALLLPHACTPSGGIDLGHLPLQQGRPDVAAPTPPEGPSEPAATPGPAVPVVPAGPGVPAGSSGVPKPDASGLGLPGDPRAALPDASASDTGSGMAPAPDSGVAPPGSGTVDATRNPPIDNGSLPGSEDRTAPAGHDTSDAPAGLGTKPDAAGPEGKAGRAARDPDRTGKADATLPGADSGRIKMPDDPAAARKLGFLEGDWRAGDGLADKQTGQPLDLSFRFGKEGRGEVTLRRPDGTVCRGAVQGRMNGAKLGIAGSQAVPCSGGGSYGAPRIECNKDRGGRTQCFGVNPDGSRYFMDMQRR